jgi:putative ABC transport system ATP-binding protein
MLEARNLAKTYGLGEVQVRALDDISFSIADGDMICIMGKSGSGKSTVNARAHKIAFR